MVSGAGLEEGRDRSLFLDMRLSLGMHLFLNMLFVMNSSGDAVQAGGFETVSMPVKTAGPDEEVKGVNADRREKV